jgi:mannonate dehydratase
MPVTITDIDTILTAPEGLALAVVRVRTSEPGLYGLGCATFTQRALAVAAAVDEYLRPLLVGRDVDAIEEVYRLATVSGYWRNGPVLANAVSGVDMALWDIKGKRAGMPVYDLLGGKYRPAAAVYRHTGGTDLVAVEDQVREKMSEGVRHVRVQHGGYGGVASAQPRPAGAPAGHYYDPASYMRAQLELFAHIRSTIGDEIELLHDVHERLAPSDAVRFAKEVEPFRLFFLEDPLAPEDIAWFDAIRSQCATPIAMGELFNNPNEWMPLINDRHIDFLRLHISQAGGLTPVRKITAAAELNGVRTAWHGPGDVSPIGHACNLHLDLVSPNFGIQEWAGISPRLADVFPGSPELRDGYLYANDQPGWGVDIDLDLAARYPVDAPPPVPASSPNAMLKPGWTEARLPDGGMGRP